jgi:hypothetical protein
MNGTVKRAVFSLALAAALAEPAFTQPNAVGINVAAPLDWDRSRAFADAMKVARDWTLPDSETLAPVDAQGWPTVDAQCPV